MIRKVTDRLYVGDANYDQETLNYLGITYVINVGGAKTGLENFHLHLKDGKNNYTDYVAIIDELCLTLKSSSTNKVLVHCRAGISRSVAIVLWYLCKTGMNFNEAYTFLSLNAPPVLIQPDMLNDVRRCVG